MRNRNTHRSHRFSSYRCLVAAGIALSLFSGQAQAFRIVSPADGTTLTSGQPVPVEVEAGREAGLVEVRYYWYPEQTDALVFRFQSLDPAPVTVARQLAARDARTSEEGRTQ